MNPEDEQLIEETIEETPKELPEAPLSIHIDAYYKGFHNGITMRFEKNGFIPAGKIMAGIDALIEKGFEPSWNKQTSDSQLHPDSIMEVTKDVISHPCETCASENIVSDCEFKSGVKKATGKPWAGWFCKRNPDHVSWTNARAKV